MTSHAVDSSPREYEARAPNDVLPLLYILGGWHSGSTILSVLLGRHSRIVSVGELSAFERQVAAEDATGVCSCGEPFSRCDFWSDITEKLERRIGRGGVRINKASGGEFCRSNTELFREIVARSGKQVICDSSKSWLRLRNILGCPSIKPVVIYLVRDARAIGYSALRKGRRIGAHERKKFQYEQAIRHWVRMQATVMNGLAATDATRLTVRYEDLIRQPRRWLSLILSTIDLEFEADQLVLENIRTHFVEGNRLRYERELTLRLDKEYLSELSDRQWKIGTELAQPFLSSFGYDLDRPPI